MARVALSGGAYTARSLIAACQRQVNLYGEENPEGSAAKMTLYPTPGLRLLASPPTADVGRGLFRASNNQLYAAVGASLYVISSSWVYTLLGPLAGGLTTTVSMADNGTTLLAVDGTSAGYTVTLATNAFGTVTQDAFYGADRVDFIDTFFVLNKPGTGEFYCSDANAVTFNPLYFATKIGYADLLATIAVLHREIWLLGQTTTEVFVNSGAATFPFEIMNGAFIQHGCVAKYSIATAGDALFWISQDQQGQGVILRGSGYQASRVSTHAIETAIAKYTTISDAIGFTYQQEGHQFYVLTFPTADKTWCFDLVTNEWHERSFLDRNGLEHRHRANCAAFAYGVNVCADWQNGNLYALDLNTYTDNGAPILRRRSFPHMVENGNRVIYTQFLADMEVGTTPGLVVSGQPKAVLGVAVGTALGADSFPFLIGLENGSFFVPAPDLYLRWSDDRGSSWSNPVSTSFGATGDYLNSLQFQRLGMARDRVFELFWSSPVRTSLQGAWVEHKVMGS